MMEYAIFIVMMIAVIGFAWVVAHQENRGKEKRGASEE